VYEVIFKIRHRSCPFNMISVKYPNAVISSWCNERVDVFDVKGKTEDVMGVLKGVQGLVYAVGGKVKHRSYDGTTGRVLAVSWGKNCTCHRIMKNAKAIEIDRLIQRHFCVNIYPTVYRDGYEQYRIMGSELCSLW
jgi:predicted DNA binding protein